MIVRNSDYVIISKNSNTAYWDEGLYPRWAAINIFCYFPHEKKGSGVEPHYHDGDEIWLFPSGSGEVRLDGKSFEITPNSVVYTPMGVVHSFQMYTDGENIALVTRLERQKRATHILVAESGPPTPTVPGFVIPGAVNNGPIADPGPRCPLTELRVITFAVEERIDNERLACNEHWLVVEGTIHLTVQGFEVELSSGDVALLRAGSSRQIRADKNTRVALARERISELP